MIKTLRHALLVLLLGPTIIVNGQTHEKIFHFPDIDGYQTLLCDFHMHTVFSDGLVWPTVRVDEAVAEGLDAISITEHIEYQPHSADMKGDHNRAYEIAKERADNKGLMLIKGAEITRDMPPGHFNALFLEDANLLDEENWQDAIKKANEQGAFVFWSHPGWRQTDEIPIWYEEHSWLLSLGLIQGLEIVNENSYYPLAHQWGIDSNLSLVGNSDIHDPVDMFFDKCKGEHRPITLVFAKEHSVESIHDALNKRRTAVYYKDLIIGDEQFLKPLFLESVNTRIIFSSDPDINPVTLISNSASLAYELIYIDESGNEGQPILCPPGESTSLGNPEEIVKGKWMIKNVLVAPGKSLVVDLY